MIYIKIFCDGSYHSKSRYARWAVVIVKNEEIIEADFGYIDPSKRNSVELVESVAIWKACQYCKEHKGNYIIYSDSKSAVNKINSNCNNCSGNRYIKGIQNIISEYNGSIEPISISLRYKKRCSDKFMIMVDELSRV